MGDNAERAYEAAGGLSPFLDLWAPELRGRAILSDANGELLPDLPGGGEVVIMNFEPGAGAVGKVRVAASSRQERLTGFAQRHVQPCRVT
jgi:hypothetical protein